MTGTMVASHNTAIFFIVGFEFCEITWTRMITFLSNICDYVIYLKSFELATLFESNRICKYYFYK